MKPAPIIRRSGRGAHPCQDRSMAQPSVAKSFRLAGQAAGSREGVREWQHVFSHIADAARDVPRQVLPIGLGFVGRVIDWRHAADRVSGPRSRARGCSRLGARGRARLSLRVADERAGAARERYRRGGSRFQESGCRGPCDAGSLAGWAGEGGPQPPSRSRPLERRSEPPAPSRARDRPAPLCP